MKLQRILMLNMSGDDVKFLQQRLKDLNFYKGKISGNYTQDTLISVVNFQKDVGLKSDGVISLQAWSQLINYDKKAKKIIIDDVPYKLAYVGNDGLKIYDSKISDIFYYKTKSKKTTIWIKNTLSKFNPDDNIGNWDLYMKRDKSGKEKELLKTSTHFTIGGFDDNDKFWDGKIIRNFDDSFWSYNSPLLNDNKKFNMANISIELCNLGPLINRNDKFYTKSGLFVNESEVVDLEFRNYKYFHKYTKAQIDSLGKLIKYLKEKWDINTDEVIFDDSWFEYNKNGPQMAV